MAGVSALNTVNAMGYTLTIPSWLSHVIFVIFVVTIVDLVIRLIRDFCSLKMKENDDV